MRTRLYWNRETYRWEDRPTDVAVRTQIINDDFEGHSQADGGYYTSKSRYRADLKARGYIEMGNERVTPERPAISLGGMEGEMRRVMERMG